MSTWGVIELGGTKALVGYGSSLEDLDQYERVDTTQPEATVAAIASHLTGHQARAVGLASFGPLDLDVESSTYGHVTATPKPGWSWFNLVGALETALGAHVILDTDVNAAALGEASWGSASDASLVSYVTVGTGVGGGLVSDGHSLRGSPHTEFGHVVVRRADGDDFPGTCPFHGSCLEGMIAGPAIERRFGIPSSELTGSQRDEAVGLVVGYLAQGLRNLVYSVAPERIVVGGGVSKLPGFYQTLHAALEEELAGYPETPGRQMTSFVVAPGLGDRSGLAGALILAQQGRP